MKTIIISSILFLSSASLFSQNMAHRKGDSLYQHTNDMSAAIESYQIALEQYKQSADTFNVEVMTINISRSFYTLAVYDSVQSRLSSVQFTHPDNIFRKYRQLGDIAFALNRDYKGAIRHYHKSRRLLKVVETVTIDDRINLLFYLAEAHNSLWQYDSARHYLALSLEEAVTQTPEGDIQKAKYYYSIAKTFIFEKIPDSVRYYLAKSKSAFKRVDNQQRDYYFHLSHLHEINAYFYNAIGYRDSVMFHAGKEMEYLRLDPQTDKLSLAQAHVNAANDRINEGLLDQATDHLEIAMEIYETIVSKNHRNLAMAYKVKGRLLATKSYALNEALGYFSEAVTIQKATYGDNHPATAEAKNYAADIFYRQGEYDKAVFFFKDAQRIAHNSHTQQHLMEAHLGIGKALTALGQYDEAQYQLEEGWNMLRDKLGNRDFRNGSFAMAMAELYLEKNNSQKAILYYEQAIDVYQSNIGNTHPALAGAYVQMARLYLSLQNYDKALALLKKSTEANKQPDFSTEQLAMADFGIAMEINALQAQTLLAKFDIHKEEKMLIAAKALYQQNSEGLFDLLLYQKKENDLEYYSTLHKETFQAVVSVIRKELLLNPSEQLKQELFLFSEKSRAVLLRLQQTKVLSSSKLVMSQPKIREISNKQEFINYYKGLYYSTPTEDTSRRAQYQSVLFNLSLELNELKASDKATVRLTSKSNLKGDLTSFQNELKPDQTVLEYMIQGDQLLIFVLSRNSYDYKEVELSEEFQLSIDSFKESLKNEDVGAFKKASTKLYELLILPVKPMIQNSRVIIVPDEQLWNINFDLLIAPDSIEHQGFKAQNYLLKEYNFSYAYSLAGLIQSKEKLHKAQHNLLALSYDKEAITKPELKTMRNSRLADLPGTSLEIFNLNKIIEGDYLFGKEASERAFKKKAGDFQVLHLAVHADVDSLNNELTRMYFIQNQEDSLEDGLLHTYEIYDMRLNAELAVLSACNTGSGLLSSGEGVMSLGRAFQYAGVKSLLLSQWDVSDAAAPSIMEDFYTGLAQGLPKDEALRLAKINFLENANNISANPLYWGSFFILGNADAIDLEDDGFFKESWPVAILIMVLLAFLVLKRRRVDS